MSSTTFDIFFNSWLDRGRALLDQLVSIDDVRHEADSRQLIGQLLAHYADYYEEKAKLIGEDIFLLFSPPWLSSFEKTFLWVAGSKPSIAFGLVEVSVSNVVSEQVGKLEQLKAETTKEERKLMDALASVQESMASPPLLHLARQERLLVDGELSDFDVAIKEVRQSLAKVVQSADNLRRITVMKVVDILDMKQSLKFLAAVSKYQLAIRELGLQNDDQTK